jgi:hypothetical protein
MEKFEAEKKLLQDFGNWMEKYSGIKSEASIVRVWGDLQCQMPVYCGAPLKIVDGVPVPTSGVGKTFVKILWKIYQEQKSGN